MKYIVYYITDTNKRLFEKVFANSKDGAELIVRRKYNDIKEIVQVSEA